jgi:hypothetical protein
LEDKKKRLTFLAVHHALRAIQQLLQDIAKPLTLELKSGDSTIVQGFKYHIPVR